MAALATRPDLMWGMRVVFLLGPFLGPFVGLFGPMIEFEASSVGYCLVTGLPLLGMVLAHPLRPSWWTGILSAVGLSFWFLLGLVYIHQYSA